MAERLIAYLWAPYFGATVAQQVEPALSGRPLVLLDEQRRVLAVDPLAAQAGVQTGLNEQQAAGRCPQALLTPAACFPLWEAQERFLDQVKRYAERWQPDGLGRVYLDAGGAAHAGDLTRVNDRLLAWCQTMADAVRSLGLRPALGATGSKFGASVAGQVAWQNAALLLAPAAQRAFLADQPVAVLPLDPDALVQLHHLGIRTLGHFARLPATGVLARFGPAGRTAQRWALGLDERPVIPPWEAPEVAARHEFETPLADSGRLLRTLTRQAEQLLAPLRTRLQAITRVLLTIIRADGRVVTVAHTFPLPTAAAEPVRLALADLLVRVAWDGQGAAEATLTLAGITDAPAPQLTLFDFSDHNRARLTATLEHLTARYGPTAFRLATLVDPDHLLPERRAAFRAWQ